MPMYVYDSCSFGPCVIKWALFSVLNRLFLKTYFHHFGFSLASKSLLAPSHPDAIKETIIHFVRMTLIILLLYIMYFVRMSIRERVFPSWLLHEVFKRSDQNHSNLLKKRQTHLHFLIIILKFYMLT